MFTAIATHLKTIALAGTLASGAYGGHALYTQNQHRPLPQQECITDNGHRFDRDDRRFNQDDRRSDRDAHRFDNGDRSSHNDFHHDRR